MTCDINVQGLPVARLINRARHERPQPLPEGLRIVHETSWSGQMVQIGLQTLPQEMQNPESFRTFLMSLHTGPSRYAGMQHAAGLVTDRIGRPIPDEWMRFLVLFPGTQYEDADGRISTASIRRFNALLTWECGGTSFVEQKHFLSIQHVRIAVLLN